MRKLLSMSLVALLFCITAWSQEKSITGKIIDSSGNPVPFATVKIQGAKSGEVADGSGIFIVKAHQGDVIQVTSTGYATQTLTVGSGNVYTIVLNQNLSSNLTEVIVTGAYNLKRTSRSTSYNAQVVTGNELNTIRQTNLNNALAGKVSGLQVRSQSIGKLGNAGSIRLRGAGGLGGGDDLIYVVDGTILPDANDINLDDIESVTVLQGPAASAQFGSQGANGAIVMTTKRGSKNTKGIGVDVNIGAQYDKAYILPNYQNTYAGGSSADMQKYIWQEGQPEEWKALSGKYFHNYDDDASWGPRMVGQEYIPWYAWYGGTEYSFKTAKLTPQPNNAKDFYNTGVVLNNSVSLNKATDNTNLRFSYGNIYISGILPNSSLKKNTLNLSLSQNINSHLILGVNINYISQIVKGEVGDNSDDYSNQSSGSFNQWFHRDLDMGIMKELQNLRTPEGIYASWNHNNPSSYSASNPKAFYAGNYWYNFYTWFNLINVSNQKDRLYGDVSLSYKITNDIKVKATYRKQQNTTWYESKYSTDLLASGTQTSGNNALVKGYYGTSESYSNRENLEFLASYSKKFNDLQLDINVGSDFFRWNSKSNGANTNNGLIVPNYYAVSNSVDQPSVSNYRIEEKYKALYAIGNIGYKNLLFVDFSLRNDWYSTLPQNNNDVLSKSFGASFVFSDLVKVPGLSFGKIRASWGEIPQALGTSATTFGAYRFPGASYAVNQYQWNGNILTSTPNQLVDSAIHGAVKTQKEIGIELKFLQNRLGVSATYWDGTEKDFPTAITINGTSGFTSFLTNAGEISKKGIDLQVSLRPIWNKNFSWEINGTWGLLLENKVISISSDTSVKRTTSINTIWGTTGPYLVQTVGQEWGQLYGNGIKRINGQPVLDDNGFFENDPNINFGSVLPKYSGGIQNSFQIYKDFLVNVNIDYQVGGKFFSLSDMWGSYSGLTARTATFNDKNNPVRDAVADGGGIHTVGVDETGKAVDYYVDAQEYFHNLYNNKTFDPYVYNLTYVKLREISLGYSIPVAKLGSLNRIISRAEFSIVARNPVLIYADTKDFDPSEISDLAGETGNLPGTRGIGFNLKVSF